MWGWQNENQECTFHYSWLSVSTQEDIKKQELDNYKEVEISDFVDRVSDNFSHHKMIIILIVISLIAVMLMGI